MVDDPKASEQEKRDAGRDLAAERTAINNLLATYEGRRWMWELLAFCGPYRARYSPGADALEMAWRDGRAAVGARLIEMIDQHAADQYLRMVREHQTRLERKRESEAAKTTEPTPEPVLETALERMAAAQAER